MSSARRFNTDHFICAGLFAAAALFRFAFEFHQYDDAYITFRYAINLLAGKGFVYNEGARVLGTTTPLFTILLAAAGFVFRTTSMPIVANCINHLADGGSAVLLYLIGMRIWRSRPLAMLLGLYFVFSFHSVFNSSTGMETSFYSFLLLLSLHQMLSGRPRAAFTVCALALMTRPDALMLLVVLIAWQAFVVRKPPRPIEFLPGLILLAVYFGFLLFYFGSVVPQSVVAKAVLWNVGHGLFSLRFENAYEVMMFWSGFLIKVHYRETIDNILQAIPTVLLFASGCFEIARRDRRMLLLPAFGLLFTAAYGKSGGFLFAWYLIPTVPYLVLATFAGLVLLATSAGRVLKYSESKTNGLAAAALAIVLMFQSMVYFGAKESIPSVIQRVMYPAHTQKLYRHALTLIHPYSDDYTIMAPELGYIGYFRPRAKMIDPFGLTNPEVTSFYKYHPEKKPVGVEAVTPAIVQRLMPDVIISVYPFIDKKLFEDPFFKTYYEKIEAPLDESFTNREPVAIYQLNTPGFRREQKESRRSLADFFIAFQELFR